MEIILIILGVIGFVYLNNRISSLERKSQGGFAPIKTATSTPTPTIQTASQTYPQSEEQPVSAYNTTPATVSTATFHPVPPVRTESTEELGGRWLGKIGIAALLIGVSFFLKYTFDNNIIGVTGRVMLGIVAGIFLLGLGQFLRKKYRLYSDVIMGGGIGVLYLTVYAAFAFYHLIPQSFAFGLIALVTLVSVVLSIIDDALTLAVLGIVGGFLTPLLISFTHDSLFGLFTYIVCLDGGVLLVSVYKRWIKLNYIAFAGTFIMFSSWFGSFYQHDDMPVVIFFLSIFFIIFLISTIAHHIFRREKTEGLDIALITINALGYFILAHNILAPDFADFMGFFAFGLAALYVIVSYIAYLSNPEDQALNIYLPGLAIVFLTISIPLQFHDIWIPLAWLIESVVLAFIATSLKRPAYVIFSIIVYGLGLLNLFGHVLSAPTTTMFVPLLNQQFFLFVVAIVVAYLLAFLFSKSGEMEVMGTQIKTLVGIFVVVANILTIFAITNEISRLFDQQIKDTFGSGNITSLMNQKNTVISIFWALYSAILIAIGFILPSKLLRSFGLIFFFLTAFKIFIDVWSLGELYRIISSIIFGIIALVGSFAYAKYKHRIKEIIL